MRGRNPETGDYFDDTKKYLDACNGLSDSDRRRIFEGSVRRVYPRLDAALRKRGQ